MLRALAPTRVSNRAGKAHGPVSRTPPKPVYLKVDLSFSPLKRKKKEKRKKKKRQLAT